MSLNNGTMSLFSSIDGIMKDYKILIAFKKIIIEEITFEEKISLIGDKETYNRLLITNLIFDDIKTFKNNTLREKLNEIIRDVFQTVKLVLVHNEFGYKPISDLKGIYCNRITSGLPRCKIT